ncbi:MAG: hypothetical protein RL685_6023 [Pseudomonadota bacterium]
MQPQLRNIATPIAGPSTLALADALTRVEMSALRDDELAIINLDIQAAVTQVRSALPELREVEAQMLLRWREPPVGLLARLERYAGALLHAHGVCQGLKGVHPDISGMARELGGVRHHLLCCTHALMVTGTLTPESLAPFQHAKGHRSLAHSVSGIVAVCWTQWRAIEHKTPLSMAELDQAQALAQRLLHALRHRNAPVALAHALRARRQAFTLLMREYTELRRAALFLYPTREAERRVPSLFGRRARARRRPSA